MLRSSASFGHTERNFSLQIFVLDRSDISTISGCLRFSALADAIVARNQSVLAVQKWELGRGSRAATYDLGFNLGGEMCLRFTSLRFNGFSLSYYRGALFQA
jgi:hypothetical protein